MLVRGTCAGGAGTGKAQNFFYPLPGPYILLLKNGIKPHLYSSRVVSLSLLLLLGVEFLAVGSLLLDAGSYCNRPMPGESGTEHPTGYDFFSYAGLKKMFSDEKSVYHVLNFLPTRERTLPNRLFKGCDYSSLLWAGSAPTSWSPIPVTSAGARSTVHRIHTKTELPSSVLSNTNAL